MACDKNGKKLPKGISYREKEKRYMGRFMYHGEPFSVYGKTLKETQQKLDNLKYEVKHNIYFKEENVTFSAWFEIWIKDYKTPSVKMGTVCAYRECYNVYIKDTFGNKQLRDIRTDNIQRFYNRMAIKYSRNTLEVCRAILNGVFKQAIRNEVIQKNPVTNAVLPKGKKKKAVEAMTEEEQSIFLKYARDSSFFPLFELALATGMRSGEIRGLRWEDVNFEQKTIYITCTLIQHENIYYLVSPKTESSEREIPMLDNVYRLLKKQKKKQMEERIELGNLWQPIEGMENLVFTKMDGKPISNARFTQEIKKVVRKINKAGVDFKRITPHVFRHTFATRSIEKGIPPKVLQTILGHKDLSTTMDTYAHVMPNTKASEIQKLSGLFY